MDLLYQRYASPFSFMDGMIQTGRFSEFVVDFIKTVKKEEQGRKNWEFFLHKVWDEITFEDFQKDIEINAKNQNMSAKTIETTVNESMDILKNFNPQ